MFSGLPSIRVAGGMLPTSKRASFSTAGLSVLQIGWNAVFGAAVSRIVVAYSRWKRFIPLYAYANSRGKSAGDI